MNDSHISAAAQKSERICLRVSHLDKAFLKKKAKSVHLSLSEYLVAAGLDRHISMLPSPVTMEFNRQLSRIGNNLNQLTYRVHCGDSVPQPPLQAIARELKLLREAVK